MVAMIASDPRSARVTANGRVEMMLLRGVSVNATDDVIKHTISYIHRL